MGNVGGLHEGQWYELTRDHPTTSLVRPGEFWRVRVDPRGIAYPLYALGPDGQEPEPPLIVLAQEPTLHVGAAEPEPTPAERARPSHPEDTRDPAAPLQSGTETDRPPRGRVPATPMETIQEGERVAIFADDINMAWACQQLGFKIDWGKAAKLFTGNGYLTSATFFMAEPREDGIVELQERFAWALIQTGFTIHAVRAKPVRAFPGGRKVNLNTHIVARFVEAICQDEFDVAVVFSGDGDLVPALEIARAHKKTVYVVSTRACLALDLANAASRPVFHLEHFRKEIERLP